MEQERPDQNAVDMDLFLRISTHRMTDHYLIKLLRAIRTMDQEQLWRHPSVSANSTGGIVLHIVEHVRRSAARWTERCGAECGAECATERAAECATERAAEAAMAGNAGAEQGIEDHFPDVDLSPDALETIVESVFHGWREVMGRMPPQNCKDDDMHHLFHVVEHTGHHLGQIVDRAQVMASVSFRFCQNGVNERELRRLIENRSFL